MHNKTVGLIFVACQMALLLALVLLPTGDAWSSSSSVRILGLAFVLGGLAIVVAASLNLGPALTASPMPNGRGQLRTDGFYGYVRHPIYSGVLLIVAGLVIRSANWLTLAVGVATVSFFHVKAEWEERRLCEEFQDYESYAAVTPRFFPRLSREHV